MLSTSYQHLNYFVPYSESSCGMSLFGCTAIVCKNISMNFTSFILYLSVYSILHYSISSLLFCRSFTYTFFTCTVTQHVLKQLSLYQKFLKLHDQLVASQHNMIWLTNARPMACIVVNLLCKSWWLGLLSYCHLNFLCLAIA